MTPTEALRRLVDSAEMLWVVLANVSGGDWTKQTQEWQDAAARWRDEYFEATRTAQAALGAGHISEEGTACANCHAPSHTFIEQQRDDLRARLDAERKAHATTERLLNLRRKDYETLEARLQAVETERDATDRAWQAQREKANTVIRDLERQRDALAAALTAMVDRYVSLVNSGDCGNWNPETEADVIAARKALDAAAGR